MRLAAAGTMKTVLAMMAAMLYGAMATVVQLGVQYSGNTGLLVHDPARTHLSVANTLIDTGRSHNIVYPNRNGLFTIDTNTDTETTLLLTIESLDLFFPSPHFTLHVVPDGNTTIQQYDVNTHESLQKQLPLVTNNTAYITRLVIQSDVFRFQPLRYASNDVTPSAMNVVSSIPFLAPILYSKWTLGIFIVMVVLAALPTVITYLDPSFADRMLEQQRLEHEQQKQKKQ